LGLFLKAIEKISPKLKFCFDGLFFQRRFWSQRLCGSLVFCFCWKTFDFNQLLKINKKALVKKVC